MNNRSLHLDRWLLGSLTLLATGSTALAQQPASVQLTGIVRDFKPAADPGGHPDFEPSTNMGRYAGNMAPMIGDDGKPVFVGGGAKIQNQWRDSANRQISYVMYENFPAAGDVEGSFGQPGTGGITSPQTFAHWFKDTPVYNMSAALTITLTLQSNGLYVFDDQLDPLYVSLGGFFPIDNQLFGNTPGNGNGGGGAGANNDHNFHFTFEIHASFTYDQKAGQTFKFEGTDSVWLYIDGNLVNDLAGVHAAHDQFVSVDRLGLVDGESYELDFFFAQRFEPQSHFRIETNILLNSLPITTVSAVFD